jgi:flagellar biosynthesis anti-sigma factor FlgM
MRIHGSDPLDRLRNALARLDEQNRTERQDQPQSVGRGGGRPQPPADEVRLSPRAEELHRLRDAIEQSPEIREELVDRLREEIRSGDYHIDGVAIASSMLREPVQLDLVDGSGGDHED